MKILKPRFWGKNTGIFALLLFPISLLIQFLITIKNRLTTKHSFKISIICVGNIYLGGTGKTPLSILIANELKKKHKKPAIIKKYYKNHIDEHNLIKSYLIPLFLSKERSKAIINAEKKLHNVAILDDGFQDHSVKKDLNILCFSGNQLIGNGMTLPSGPLRENMSSINKTQIAIINGNRNIKFEKKILSISNRIKIFYTNYLPLNIKKFKKKKIYAFAGIGNPENFFNLLKKNNLKIYKKVVFPDHYQFSKNEIQKLIEESSKKNCELVTTEKDYNRIKTYGFKEIKFIKVKLDIDKKKELINEILDYI